MIRISYTLYAAAPPKISIRKTYQLELKDVCVNVT